MSSPDQQLFKFEHTAPRHSSFLIEGEHRIPPACATVRFEVNDLASSDGHQHLPIAL
jgi:hypothetical protein